MDIPIPNFNDGGGIEMFTDRNASARRIPPSIRAHLKITSDGDYLKPKAAAALIEDIPRDIGKVVVGDTRTESEYWDLHVNGSILFKQFSDINKVLKEAQDQANKTCLLLYSGCTQKNAEKIFKLIRSTDRNQSIRANTSLVLADMYIIEGGIELFSQQYSNLCVRGSQKVETNSNLKEEKRKWKSQFDRGKSFRSFSTDIFDTASLYCNRTENIGINLNPDIKFSRMNVSQPNVFQ